MKIGLVVPGFSRDGDDWAIPALQALACRLAREHDVHVFSLRYPARGRYTFCSLTHHATGGGVRAGLASLSVVGRTVRAILAEQRRSPFDLLHAFWVDEPALVAVLAGRLLRRPAMASVGGGELVYLPEAGYGTWGSRWRRRLIRNNLGAATLLTAGSRYAADLCLARGAPAGALHVVPLGVDTGRFFPAQQPPAGPPVLIQAASLAPVKNQALLLAVLARVARRLPAVRLLVAGDGPLRSPMEAEARRLDIGEKVIWLGAVPHPQMAAVYHRAHVYLQTSLHESQGMAVLEAMACGVPALGTPVGLLPQVAALSSASQGATGLTSATLSLLEDDARYERCRAEAIRASHATFSLEQTTARFTALYERIGQ